MIDNNKLQDTLGFEYYNNIDGIQGPARNNHIFAEILYWKIEKIKEFQIKTNINENKFRFIYKLNNEENKILMGSWNKIKSFGSKLFDFLLLSPSKIDLMNSFTNNLDLPIIKTFLNKWTKTAEAIKNLEESFNNKTQTLFQYWKKLSQNNNNHYTKWVIPRIRLIIYKNIREINDAYKIEKCDILLSKQWRIANLEKILDHFIFKIILNNNINSNESILEKEENDINDLNNNDQKIFSLTIKQLVKSVENGSINIPIFQRNYVWNIKKIISLLNSILKKYPIGSILLAKTISPFKTKNVIIEAIKINPQNLQNQQNEMWIIDGQQRITSILLCVAYLKIKNKQHKTVDDEIVNILTNSQVKNICLIENDEGPIFESIKKIPKSQNYLDFSIVNKKINKKIMNLIGNYEIAIIKTDKLEIEQLIDIFNNINIGSLKLTNIDLLHSSLYASNSENDLLKTLKQILKSNFIKGWGVPKEKIVQIMKIIYDYNNFKKNEDIHSVNLNIKSIFKIKDLEKFVENNWATQKTLELTIKILDENYGFVNYNSLPNDAFLFVVSTICIKNINNMNDIKINEYKINENIIQKIDQKFTEIIKRTINKDYSAGTAIKINNDIQSIFLNKNRNIEIKQALSKEIEEANYGKKSSIYKIIVAQLSLKHPVSLTNGQTQVRTMNTKYSSKNNDQHHFLPKKCQEFKLLKKEIGNNVQNIFLITDEENRTKISNKSPKKYLLKENKDQTQIDYLLKNIAKTHLLDYDKLKNFYSESDEKLTEKKLRNLLNDRSEKMVELLNNKWHLDE